jgi:hypothetical protein
MIPAEILATTVPSALNQARHVVVQAGLASRVQNENVVTGTNSPTASPKVDQVVITPSDEGMKFCNSDACFLSFLNMFAPRCNLKLADLCQMPNFVVASTANNRESEAGTQQFSQSLLGVPL